MIDRQVRGIRSVAAVGFLLFFAGMADVVRTQGAPPRVDYLTFAQGAVPVRVGGTAAPLGANIERALQAIDGNPVKFTLTSKPGSIGTDTEFIYALPARTTFDRFAVPDITETPSPTQTFTKIVEVYGSATSADEGYVLLASATLQNHKARGQVTELTLASKTAVSWVKLRLRDGIDAPAAQMFFEFSEIIGNGTQEPVRLVDHFNGIWQGRGVLIELKQDGAVVSGCYDTSGRLTGTVTGNLLRATGVTLGDKAPSTFILSVGPDGVLRGVASSNNAPFRLYTGPRADGGVKPKCAAPLAPALGCGSIIHGITFAYDSAEIRAESEPILAALHAGLRTNKSASIVIEGHTSNEGTNEYNQRLSERRAQAVVADLTRRGLAATRLTALGAGEIRPIATNDDESGRSLNRRVEVKCK